VALWRCDVEALCCQALCEALLALWRCGAVRRCLAVTLRRCLALRLWRCDVEALDRPKVEKIMRSTSFSSCVCAREAHRPLCSMSGAAVLDERRRSTSGAVT
jgi:hypothetical protein